MKKILLLLVCGSVLTVNAQVDPPRLSDFEIKRGGHNQAYSEEMIEVLKLKNLNLRYSILISGTDTLGSAFRFDVRAVDGQVRAVPLRTVSYLDYDELPGFLLFLKNAIAMRDLKPYEKETVMHYASRGGVVAAAYLNKGKWKFAVSSDSRDLDAYSFLGKTKLEELIRTLETFH